VDLVRFGVVIRALRRRKGWRQADLAAAAAVSQGVVSLIERGYGGRMAFDTLLRVANALEARLALDLRWRAGELDRLLDQDHSALAALVARRLGGYGWDVQFEVTYAVYRATGSIDVLAWHAAERTLLVIEIKTEVTSGESTLRKLDEKVRLAGAVASERFGWRASTVARLLVVQDITTARDQIRRSPNLFDAAFPSRAVDVRSWLRAPQGGLSGLLFVRLTNHQRGTGIRHGRHRMRVASKRAEVAASNVALPEAELGSSGPATRLLTNRT
jgi:transcriptional regulator with XRE-family HTH domain